MKQMKRVQWLIPFVVLIALLCFSTASAQASSRTASDASVSSDAANLMPDPWAYCVTLTNVPQQWQMQQAVNGGQISFQNLVGDPGQNNWGCLYAVWASVPIPGTDCGDQPCEATVPVGTYTVPIDWNAMCNQQYPGAHAEWIPGPETGVDGAPWGCVGAPGVIYDPAEQADGTHLVVSGG